MRQIFALLAICMLYGCGNPQAVRDEVQTKLNAGNVGKSVDQMVLNFGPPKATASLNNGDKIFDWYLGSTLDDNGAEHHCTIRVVANSKGIVQKVTTIDAYDEWDEDTLCSRSIRF